MIGFSLRVGQSLGRLTHVGYALGEVIKLGATAN